MNGIGKTNAHGHKIDTILISRIHQFFVLQFYLGKPIMYGSIVVVKGANTLNSQIMYAIYIAHFLEFTITWMVFL